MHNTLRVLASTLITISGVMLTGCGEHYPGLPAKDAPAPDFTLLNQDGKPVSLKDYRGQWVVLYFYPDDFGKQGTGDLHSFQRDLRKFQELHAVVLGISGDDAARHKAFADQQELPFTLLSDTGLKVTKEYGSFHRTHFVRYMIIYSTFIVNPDGKIARVLYDFGAPDPGEELLNAINALEQRS